MEELRSNGTASAVTQQIRALHGAADELLKLDNVNLEMNNLSSAAVTVDAAAVQTHATGQRKGTPKSRQTNGK